VSVLDPNGIILHRTGRGAPLVLLHCLGVDHHFWDFARDLGDDFTLLRYDLPGHGGSPTPARAYGIADLSAQLVALLDREHIARASIAGISLGGLIAQHVAARHPARVDRLVLIDTTPRYSDDMRAMWAQRAATARTAGVGALIDNLLKIWFTAAALAANGPGVNYVRGALARTSGEGYARACEALAAADLRDGAARIEAPWSSAAMMTFRASLTPRAGWPRTSMTLAWFGLLAHATPRCWSIRHTHCRSCANF
jgi:pimeloyl-ACP methyl ester carboxylesterase